MSRNPDLGTDVKHHRWKVNPWHVPFVCCQSPSSSFLPRPQVAMYLREYRHNSRDFFGSGRLCM